MALTAEQRWIASKIDTRMRKLAGKDDRAILAAMADHMPKVKLLLDTTSQGDLDQLIRAFPGLLRYAQVLERLAGGIAAGAIPGLGQTARPRPTPSTIDCRPLAAAIDLRMRQLAEEAVPPSAIIADMAGHVVDLGKIWNATTDDQLATLCRDYPGFHRYAVLMEEAAEAERQKPARPYDGLPELPEALKKHLSSLLSIATQLERDYHALLHAADTSVPLASLALLNMLHAEWEAGLTRFTADVQRSNLPQASRDVLMPVIERMTQQIGKLHARIQAL
jgi:hypothetical protein